MNSRLITRVIAVAVGLAAALGGGAVASAATAPSGNTGNGHNHGIRHVLLTSVDGMHQSDLDWYVANYPNSELARLATGGAECTNAQDANPSDSAPTGTGLMTGVYAPGTVRPGQSSDTVETTQVAPTVLKLLGLSPASLLAVQQEGTQVLPGLGDGD